MTNRPLIVIGYSPLLLKEFGRIMNNSGPIIFIEEPQAAEKRNVDSSLNESSFETELILWEILRPEGADSFFLTHSKLEPVAVIPANDYATPAAARLAERYGLLGAGLGAALLMRDKYLLREVSRVGGVPNPLSREVVSKKEALAFQRGLDTTVVIKPANRQASIGTVIVHDADSLASAWEITTAPQDEDCLPDREPELRILVEQFVTGEEYSVEMLYSEGTVAFENVTAKILFRGSRPVEQGQLVPAPIPDALSKKLFESTRKLLSVIGFGTGLIHCEWIVMDGTPYLVECAGRQPGDFILELIRGAYDFDIFGAYLDLMTGRLTEGPQHAIGGAVTWHEVPPPGTVTTVEGVDEVRDLVGIDRCDVSVDPGDSVGSLQSSWDRSICVTAYADSVKEARELAEAAVGKVEVGTDTD